MLKNFAKFFATQQGPSDQGTAVKHVWAFIMDDDEVCVGLTRGQ
jgi:hypothetical protein